MTYVQNLLQSSYFLLGSCVNLLRWGELWFFWQAILLVSFCVIPDFVGSSPWVVWDEFCNSMYMCCFWFLIYFLPKFYMCSIVWFLVLAFYFLVVPNTLLYNVILMTYGIICCCWFCFEYVIICMYDTWSCFLEGPILDYLFCLVPLFLCTLLTLTIVVTLRSILLNGMWCIEWNFCVLYGFFLVKMKSM